MIAALRDGACLDSERVAAYARVLLVFELGIALYLVLATHGFIGSLHDPSTTDFVSFYAAGHLANSSAPWLVYDRVAHYAAEQAATQPGIPYAYFYYPPVYLLLCGPLAHLPYLVSYLAFEAVTLGLCLYAVRAILPSAPLSVLAAFPPVFFNFGTGQNAFLSAALFAGATVQLESRPVLSGVLFGALCYKPHLGLLVPLALAAGRHWRSFAAAAATSAGLVLLSLVVFGWPTWQAFFAAASGSAAVYGSQSALDVAGFTSPFGILLSFGAGPVIAAGVQGIVVIAAAMLVWTIWRRSADIAVRAAVLLAATQVAAPVLMYYDLMLLAVAMAWLVRLGLRQGFSRWEKSALVPLFFVPLFAAHMDLGRYAVIGATVALCGLLLTCKVARDNLNRVAGGTGNKQQMPAMQDAPLAAVPGQ